MMTTSVGRRVRERLGGVLSEGVAHTIDEAVALAQQLWPRLTAPDDRFASYLIERAPAATGAELDRAIHNWSVADLYLCWACLEGDQAAVKAFVHAYRPVIAAKLGRLRVNPNLRDELPQVLLDRMLVGDERRAPLISDYRGLGPLKAWVRVVTGRSARRANRTRPQAGTRRRCGAGRPDRLCRQPGAVALQGPLPRVVQEGILGGDGAPR